MSIPLKYAIAYLISTNPDMTVDQLHALLADIGINVGLLTVSGIRAEYRRTVREIEKLQNPEPEPEPKKETVSSSHLVSGRLAVCALRETRPSDVGRKQSVARRRSAKAHRRGPGQRAPRRGPKLLQDGTIFALSCTA